MQVNYDLTNMLEDIFSGAGGIAAAGFVIGFLLIFLGIALIFALAIYLLTALPLYTLAKNAGRPNPWLAFIPVGNIYTLCDLAPDRPFTLFNRKINVADRRNAYWVYLALTLGSGVITSVVSALAAVPVIGILFSIVSSLLGLAIAFATGAIFWRFFFDVLQIYRPNDTNNMLFSILGTIFNIVFVIFLWIIRNRQPDYSHYER